MTHRAIVQPLYHIVHSSPSDTHPLRRIVHPLRRIVRPLRHVVRPLRHVALTLSLLALSAAAGCSEDPASSEDPGALGPITGTITVPAGNSSDAVVMGSFGVFGVSTSGDTVNGVDGTPPHTADFSQTVAGSGTSRSYTYELPSDPQQFGLLVAWIDLDGDGRYDEGTEPARLPVKEIEGTPGAISYWGSFSFDDVVGYIVSPGGGENYGLDIVGSEGFDFTF